jgi:hypothetical protein
MLRTYVSMGSIHGMNRADLLDNLAISAERREYVTLTLRPVSGFRDDHVERGVMVALGEHYTGRRAPQAVLRRRNGTHIIIGISMIKDFRVGP